jgi:hypothetical protein
VERIGRIGIVALCLLALAGCGGDAEKGIETVVSSPRRSAATACEVERRAVETAVEAYRALHGEPPTSAADLLGVLAETPTYIEVEPDGSLGLTAEAERFGCTLPPP